MAPIKVGLVGYGGSAIYYHLPYILPNQDLTIVAFLQRKAAPLPESNVGPGVHCTIDYPSAKHYRTPDEFFADSEIELVIVCTRVDSHAEFARKALRSGKHVLVEKPFTVTSTEADELIALSKNTGKIVTVYHNRRYDSDFLTLQRLVTDGAFGEVTEFENRFDMDNLQALLWDDPAPGDGMLYVLGGHTIDQTLVLFGLPRSVTAFTRSLRQGCKTDDAFTIIMQYEGPKENLICTLKTTVVSRGPASKQIKYLVRGTEGTFIKCGEDQQAEHLQAGLKPTDPDFGVESEDYHGYLFTSRPVLLGPVGGKERGKIDGKIASRRGSYLKFYEDLVATIRGQQAPAVSAEESRNVIRIIELARESAKKGISIPWSERS